VLAHERDDLVERCRDPFGGAAGKPARLRGAGWLRRTVRRGLWWSTGAAPGAAAAFTEELLKRGASNNVEDVRGGSSRRDRSAWSAGSACRAHPTLDRAGLKVSALTMRRRHRRHGVPVARSDEH
jgi:hypothetical protein